MTRRDTWRPENIPVPEPHVVGLGAGLLLHLALPRRIPGGPVSRTVGAVLFLSGTGMAVWATGAAGKTDLEDPDRLVTGGPYAVSRNPMYLGWTLTYTGCSLLSGSQWPLLLLPVVAAAVHREVLGEEQRLEERFGDDYRHYARRVGRYLPGWMPPSRA